MASIRPCEPAPPDGGRRGGLSVSPGRLSVNCLSVSALASIAYGVDFRYPIESGGPAWSRNDGYTIEATADGNPSPQAMQGPMLQTLLEDRFKLKMRHETREVAVYALTVAKSGFKLQPLKEGSCVPLDPLNPPTNPAAAAAICASGGTIGLRKAPTGPVKADYHAITLDDFAKALDRAMDRRIVNKTGIAGRFDIRLKYTPDETTPVIARR